MDGYEVVIEAIERASASALRAAVAVRQIDLAGTLATVPQAVPGGTSLEAAQVLSDVWRRELPTWADNMADYSDQLSAAARRYRGDEQAARDDLHEVNAGHGGRRPV